MKLNWTIGKKLTGGFLAVSIITLTLGGFGYYGASHSEQAIKEVGQVHLPSVENLLVIKEAVNDIRGSMRSLGISGLTVAERQRQYTNLVTARERYSPAWSAYEAKPKTAEEETAWKALVPIWNAWREDNTKFVQLSRGLDATGVPDPVELAWSLERFTKDHLRLSEGVLNLMHGGVTLDGGDDHTTCNCGKWLPTFKTDNETLRRELEGIAEPHREFHAAVKEIKRLVADGKTAEATQLHQQRMMPAVKAVFARFDVLLKSANEAVVIHEQALAQLMGPLNDKQNAAMPLLDQLVQLNSKSAAQQVVKSTSEAAFIKAVSPVAAIAGFVGAMVLGILISRSISKPLGQGVIFANGLAQGDLTQHLDIHRADEIGQLAKAMNDMGTSLRRTLQQIKSGILTLAGASQELSATSTQVSSNAEETSAQATAVAAAAEQVSTNVATVATAAEEMSASIREIAKQASDAAREASDAVGIAESTNGTVQKLGQSSAEISHVIKVITSIAEQTNLLALNATIEAARAGEAGKGFAVVANEVKELARQTAKATEEIGTKIGGIQSDTDQAVTAIRNVAQAIARISTIQTTIAGAVEEQAATMNEISRNSSEASRGSQEIARNIASVNDAAKDSTQAATNTAGAANELSRLAAELDQAASQFKFESQDTEPSVPTSGNGRSIRPSTAVPGLGHSRHDQQLVIKA